MYAEERCEYCGTPYSDDRDENGLPFCECDAAEVARLHAAITEKDAEIAELKDVIKSVEWSYRDEDDDYCCPSCYGYKDPTNVVGETPGHTQSCKIRKALA